VWIAAGGSTPQPVGQLAYEGQSLAGVTLPEDATLGVTFSGPASLRWEAGQLTLDPPAYVGLSLHDETVFPLQLWPHVRGENRVWLSLRAHTLTVRVNDEVLWRGQVAGLPWSGFAAEGVVKGVRLWLP
jgi:hypothetical protein